MTTHKCEVVFGDPQVAQGVLSLKPGVNLRTGEENLKATINTLTSLERDLLILASSIFASDLAFKRGERENIIRKIKLTIPVVNHALFERVRGDIEYSLYILSHDAWEIEFKRLDGIPEANQIWGQELDSKVLLFSGGLDSFAGSVNLGYSGTKVHLVSHLTGNQNISKCQTTLFEYLESTFPNRFTRTSVRIGGVDKTQDGFPFPTDQDREETQRTRSFLFLTLAGIVARRIGAKDVIMIAENGQMAIHLPLTAARISAFSTHTAHPEFVEVMANILKAILSFDIRINNPFLYMSKAEVVRTIHPSETIMIPSTISCWMSARITGGFSHCGSCVPCLIRRIANEYNGIKINEYTRDILTEDIANLDPDDIGKRNLIELAEFAKFFLNANSEAQILRAYPEIISGAFDTSEAIRMYQRFAVEANQIFSTYPNLASVMS